MVVGQVVYLRPEGNAARRTKEIVETIIISIGRRYGVVELKGALIGCNTHFELDDLHEKSDTSPNYTVYLDEEEAINPMRRVNKQRDIIDLMSKLTYKQMCDIESYIKQNPWL